MRRLALGDRVGALLHLDDLLVEEAGAVVQQPRRPARAAGGAAGGLLDAAAVVVRVLLGAARVAAEAGDAQVGDHGARARQHAAHRDELVDVRRVEVADDLDLGEVERLRGDVDVRRVRARQPRDDVARLVVEQRDDLGRVLEELLVERRVERGDVGGVDVEDGVAVGGELLEEADVLGRAVRGRGRCVCGGGGG